MGVSWHSPLGGGAGAEGGSGGGMTSEQADQLIAAMNSLVSATNRMATALEENCWVTMDCEGGETTPDFAVVAESGAFLVDETGAYVIYDPPTQVTSETGEVVVSEAGATVIAEEAA